MSNKKDNVPKISLNADQGTKRTDKSTGDYSQNGAIVTSNEQLDIAECSITPTGGVV